MIATIFFKPHQHEPGFKLAKHLPKTEREESLDCIAGIFIQRVIM